VALNNHLRVEHLVMWDMDFSDPGMVVVHHRLMPINTHCRQWVEVRDVSRIQFQKPARIAFAPAVERRTLKRDDLIGACLSVDCIVHSILRDTQSNGSTLNRERRISQPM